MSQSIKQFEPNEVLNLNWLRRNHFKIKVINDTKLFREFWVCNYLRKQEALPQNQSIKLLLNLVLGSSRGKLYRWYKSDWNFEFIYKRTSHTFLKNLPDSGKEKFCIEVYYNDEIIGSSLISYNDLQLSQIPPHKKDSLIKIEKVISKREEMIDEKFVREKDHKWKNNREKEKTVIKMCEELATGLVTIDEVCKKYKIPYIQWVTMLQSDSWVKQAYVEALQVLTLLQNSRQLTLVDKLIFKTLSLGYEEDTTIIWDSIIRVDTLKPEWVEKKLRTHRKKLGINQLMSLKVMLNRMTDIANIEVVNEFEGMDMDELWNWIVDNYDELDFDEDHLSKLTKRLIEKEKQLKVND